VCVFRIVEHLRRFPEVFILEQGGGTTTDGLDKETLTLHKALQSYNHRTKVVEGVLQVLREEGILPDQRNEVIYLPYKTQLLIHYTALLKFFLFLFSAPDLYLQFSNCLEHPTYQANATKSQTSRLDWSTG
jgi:hypothetical protein